MRTRLLLQRGRAVNPVMRAVSVYGCYDTTLEVHLLKSGGGVVLAARNCLRQLRFEGYNRLLSGCNACLRSAAVSCLVRGSSHPLCLKLLPQLGMEDVSILREHERRGIRPRHDGCPLRIYGAQT